MQRLPPGDKSAAEPDKVAIMYDDDLTTLNPDLEFADPLDDLGPVDEEPAPAYDPEVMLPLLTAVDPQQRMLAARAFCEVEDGRAVVPLTALLTDLCPLTVR